MPLTTHENIQNQLLITQVKARRQALNISALELAQTIDISEAEYLAYENGEEAMPASVAFLISIILDGDPMALISAIESPSVSHTHIAAHG